MKFTANPYSYRRRLPHLQRSRHPLFITFHTLGFQPLPDNARDIAMASCKYEHQRRVELFAAVVMPEHVHLLLEVLRCGDAYEFPLKRIMKDVKGASAHQINRALDRSGPVWEEESFDHLLRSNERLKETIEYIRMNPVKRGLVERPDDYPWLWVNPEI